MPFIIHAIDDDDSFRKALGRLLSASGFEVMLYASALDFLASDLEKNSCGCILLDVHMPNMSGLELQVLLNSRGIPMPIIFLSGAGTIPMSVTAIKAGATNFLPKPVEKDDLLAAISSAQVQFENTRDTILQKQAHKMNLATLTKREREVLDLLILGKLNKQVAGELGTTERTIKAHRQKVMEKMNTGTFAELVSLMTKF